MVLKTHLRKVVVGRCVRRSYLLCRSTDLYGPSQLYRNDPINSTLLTAYIRQKLEEARHNTPGGPPAFDAYMQQADQLVVKQLLDAIAS